MNALDGPPRALLRYYAGAVAAVALATLCTLLLRPWMGPSVSVLFFPAIIVTAMYGGYGPSMLASICSMASLAFFVVPPLNSFSVGSDDLIHLAVFAVVAFATGSLSAARKRAEDAQCVAFGELQRTLDTLRNVSNWPVFVDAGLSAGARKLLEHAASVVGATAASAVWEADDEPWIYLATSSGPGDVVARHPPDALAALTASMSRPEYASAPFQLEHLSGRVFFREVNTGAVDGAALVEVVARETGNSLDQLYVHDRLQHLAVREDRLRVARDLHDGVLQSLTGVRFQLQALADEEQPSSFRTERLLAVERAIAIEQRELRLFIDGLKPAPSPPRFGARRLATALDTLRARLGDEWKTPIVVRVVPSDLSVPAATEHAVRLMVHEAVVNALKHAQPSRVSVDVATGANRTLQIAICNDGRGFPFQGRLEHPELVASGAGPASLRERVQSMNGRIAIDSTRTGSRVEIDVPIA
jgi:signal transduction histidine kinase